MKFKYIYYIGIKIYWLSTYVAFKNLGNILFDFSFGGFIFNKNNQNKIKILGKISFS